MNKFGKLHVYIPEHGIREKIEQEVNTCQVGIRQNK